MVPRSGIPVEYSDRQTLAFEGRGAAAGIMLDSLLGGTGVAIGIAIDEGIAKDIANNIQSAEPDYSFKQHFEFGLNQAQAKYAAAFRDLTGVVIQRFGFHTLTGDGDKVSAWMSVDFKCKVGNRKVEFPGALTSVDSLEFDAVKSQPDATLKLLDQAIQQLISSWIESGACKPG